MRLGVLAWSVVVLGCAGGSSSEPLPELTIPEGCNPLASDVDCLLPFPSDVFGVEDATMPGGRRVQLGDAALLRSPSGEPVRPPGRYPADGYSPGTQILALFGTAIDPAPLVFHTGDVAASLGDASPTVLLDAETGERILHFAELDPRAEDDARRALVIRPLVRFSNQTRYVVAVRGLTGPDGAPVAAPEGFRRIRDGRAGDHEILAPVAERYEREVFPVLDRAGVERAELQLAWDFTTESEASVTADMLAVRDDLLERLDRAPPEVTVLEVADDVDDFIARRIVCEIEVPLYMESAEPGALLARDESGRVAVNGTAEVPITVLVPRSVALAGDDAPAPRLLQFGHGFFGGRGEIDSSFVPELADRSGFVVVAADWWGMSRADMTPLLDAIATDPSHALDFTERVHQGMANFIALAEAAIGPLREIDEMQIGRAADYDDAVYYYGISNGHILGGTYLALSPRIDRGVLGSGGADYSFMMFRAHPFAAFLFVIEMFVPDSLDVQKFAVLSQATFDRIDPITYAPHVLADTYPGSPTERRVLMQIGIGDSEVPNLASHLHARALGMPLLVPAPREVPAVEEASAPLDGSAMVEFDFGIEPLPGIEAVPPEETNPVHEAVRRLDASMRQADAFLRPDGRIEATCDGPCDPE